MSIFGVIVLAWAIGIVGIIWWQTHRKETRITTSKASSSTFVQSPSATLYPNEPPAVDTGTKSTGFGKLLQ